MECHPIVHRISQFLHHQVRIVSVRVIVPERAHCFESLLLIEVDGPAVCDVDLEVVGLNTIIREDLFSAGQKLSAVSASPVSCANVESHDGCASSSRLDFDDQKGNDISGLFCDERFSAVAIHEVGEFGGVVCDAAREACFVNFQKNVEVGFHCVPDVRFHR